MIDNGHEVYSGVIGSFQRYVDSLVLLNLLPVHEISRDERNAWQQAFQNTPTDESLKYAKNLTAIAVQSRVLQKRLQSEAETSAIIFDMQNSTYQHNYRHILSTLTDKTHRFYIEFGAALNGIDSIFSNLRDPLL